MGMTRKKYLLSLILVIAAIIYVTFVTEKRVLNKIIQEMDDNGAVQLTYNLESEETPVECTTSSNSKSRFVGFWHIGRSNSKSGNEVSRDEFVQRQLGEIESMPLFNKCNREKYNITLNYVTTVVLSDETKDLLSRDGRIHEFPPTKIDNMQEDEEYYDFTTMMEMHSYCTTLPEDEDAVVFYFHTKTYDL